MFYRKILFLFLLLFTWFSASSAIFTVTSNADSGPGTLREALTLAAANGNTVKDYINFNLPDLSINGRTIVLLSNLPAITSDLLIDGSTQPGTNLSGNGAKVIIQGNYKQSQTQLTSIVYFLIKNVNDAEIDGLVIKGGYTNGFTTGLYGGNAILIDGTNKSITIGQPGKGNVIYDNSQAIQCTVGGSPLYPTKSQTDNLILKNNWIGIKEDGVTMAASVQSATTFNYVYNVVIGGDTPAEGNVFYGIFSLSPNYINDQIPNDLNYKVRNNIFGANTLQQRSTDPNVVTSGNGLYCSIGASDNVNYTKLATVDVRDNVFGCELAFQGFHNLTLQVQHNFFGVSSDQLTSLPLFSSALHLSYMQGTILIGGSDLSKGNIFTNAGHDTTTIAKDDPTVWVEDYTTTLNPLFKVELSHNSFYCNRNAPFVYTIAYDKKPMIPLSVDNLTATQVNGTAVPNARVELYYTDLECKQCQPKTYLASTYADAAGKWNYSGSLLPGYGVIAGATLNNLSSEFTDTRIYTGPTYLQITGAECGTNGSIKGYLTANAKKVEWLDAITHQVVYTGADLLNASAGKYILRAQQFGCNIFSPTLEIQDVSPVINAQNLKIVNPACGNPSGSISGLYVIYGYNLDWLDASNKIISHQYNISNLAAGDYTLRVTGQRGCVKTYGPITLVNSSGPNIDQTASIVNPSDCGHATGSITNIQATGTGTLTYSWKNAQQQQVATTKDLTNQPAGQYSLQITDQSSCGPVTSAIITIPELNNITMDETAVVNTPSTCANANGSLTGIKVTGATTYNWFNSNGTLVASTTNLSNALPGIYHLVASNASCSKQSANYTIANIPANTNYPSTKKLVNATCGLNNGSIQVIFNPGTTPPAALRWTNSAGQTVGNNALLNNINGGTYQLYVTDNNGCESAYLAYTIATTPQLQFNAASASVTNDNCSLNTGAIAGAHATGGLTPYKYTWTDGSSNNIASTPDINNLAAGNYTLTISDATTCAPLTATYTIDNASSIIPPPAVSDIKLCSPGNAYAMVNAPSTMYKYRLYGSATATVPLSEQSDGKFKISVKNNTSFYISQLSGSCESARSEMKVTVGLTGLDIANTITPNADGINDTWKISGIENYIGATVQIYNRSGQVVFNSKDYTTPFDGRMNEKDLPEGTYYYIINLNKGCGLISGTLTIIR